MDSDEDEFERDAQMLGLSSQMKAISLDDILNEADDDGDPALSTSIELDVTQQQQQQQQQVMTGTREMSRNAAQEKDGRQQQQQQQPSGLKRSGVPGNKQRSRTASSSTAVASSRSLSMRNSQADRPRSGSLRKRTGFDKAAVNDRRLRHGQVVYQRCMKQLSKTLTTPTTRNTAGLPTAMDVNPASMVIGTSRGVVLYFDAEEKLRMTLGGKTVLSYGAVTAVAVSTDSTRVLVGYERGAVVRWDLTTGKVLNNIVDAHQTPVLHVAITEDHRIAVTHEANGTVQMHQFKRILAVRVSDQTKIIGPEQDEICTIEVLRFKVPPPKNGAPLPIIVALASRRKLYLASLVPEVHIFHSQRMSNPARSALPCIAWNVHRGRNGPVPVLSYTWGHAIAFLQLSIHGVNSDHSAPKPQHAGRGGKGSADEGWTGYNSRGSEDARRGSTTSTTSSRGARAFIEVAPHARSYIMDVPCVALQWITPRVVLVLDANEHAHIIDILPSQLVDMLDLSLVQLSFSTRFGKEHAEKEQLKDYSGAVAAFNGLIYFTGLKGIYYVMMGKWRERIASLAQKQLYAPAIKLGISFYNNTALAPHQLPPNPKERQGVVRTYLVDVIEAYVDLTLVAAMHRFGVPEEDQAKIDETIAKYGDTSPHEQGADADATPPRTQVAADDGHSPVDAEQQLYAAASDFFRPVIQLCIESCLAISAKKFLFSTVFDKLGSDYRAKSVFLEALRPFIIGKKIVELPTQIMKEFVRIFELKKKMPLVEECVVRMNVRAMDIHEMVKLCWKYALFDALIYIYNTGMNEYEVPLKELMPLLQANIRAMRSQYSGSLFPHLENHVKELGCKLLLYISFCLAGLAFPQGEIPKDRARRVKWEIFRFLLREHSEGADDERETYPYLRCLLQFDTKEFLNVLGIAFDHNSKSNHGSAADDDGLAMPSTQVVIETLIYVMVKDNKGEHLYFSPEQVCHLFTFIARQMSRQEAIISVDKKLYDELLQRLTAVDATNAASGARKEEREQALLELIEIAGYAQFNVDSLLFFCDRAHFYTVCEYVYERLGQYVKIIPCYLKDEGRRHLVFPFIHRCLHQQRVAQTEKFEIRSYAIDHIEELVAVSPSDAAKLIVTDFSDELATVISLLDKNQEIQFQFMGSLAEIQDKNPEQLLFTAQLEEKYISLMCELSPRSVYPYLKGHDISWVERCLTLTIQHQLHDATAWLYEKENRFLDAFKLLYDTLRKQLSKFNKSFELFDRDYDALAAAVAADPQSDPRAEAIRSFRTSLPVILDTIARFSPKMESPSERNGVWCRILDLLIEAQQVMHTNLSKTANDYTLVMKDLLMDVVDVMSQFVAPPVILQRLLSGKGMTDRFGDIKDLVKRMFETYSYEKTLLHTTTLIMNNDVFTLFDNRRRVLRQAYSSATACTVCRGPIVRSGESREDVGMFRTGHCINASCLPQISSQIRRQGITVRESDMQQQQQQQQGGSHGAYDGLDHARTVIDDGDDGEADALMNRWLSYKGNTRGVDYLRLLSQ